MLLPADVGSPTTNSAAPSAAPTSPPPTTPEAAITQAKSDNGLYGKSHPDTIANLESSRQQAVNLAAQQGRWGDIADIDQAYAQAKIVLDVRDQLSHLNNDDSNDGQDYNGTRVSGNLDTIAAAMKLLADESSTLDPKAAAEVMKLVGPELSKAQSNNVWASASANKDILEQTGRLAMIAKAAGDQPLFDALVENGSHNDALLYVTPDETSGTAQMSIDPSIGVDTLPFYLAMAKKAAASGESQPYAVVNAIVSDFNQGPVSDSVNALVSHSEELQFFIGNLGANASPEQLTKAVNDYIANQSPEWRQKYESLQGDVARQGERLLTALSQMRSAGVPAGERQQLISSLTDSPDAQYAIRTALSKNPQLASDPQLVETRNWLADSATVGSSGLGIAQMLGSVQLQRTVAAALNGGVDSTGKPDPQRMLSQLQKLDDPGLAKSLGLSPAALHEAIGKLTQLNTDIANGEVRTPAQLQQFFETELQGKLGGASAFDPATPVGRVFGGLAGALAAVSLADSTKAALDDPSVANFLNVSVQALGLGQQGAQLVSGLASVSDSGLLAKFGGNEAFGKLLGSVGLGLGAIDAGKSLTSGDLLQGSLQTVSVIGGAVALFGSGSTLGPVGFAVGTAAALGSLGVSIYRQHEESTKYENDAGRQFLEDLGYRDNVADILVNNAGNGTSPMPVLMRWASEAGLSPQQTVAFINDLVGKEGGTEALEGIRDSIHHALDDVDGDPSKVDGSGDLDQSKKQLFFSQAAVWKMEHPNG